MLIASATLPATSEPTLETTVNVTLEQTQGSSSQALETIFSVSPTVLTSSTSLFQVNISVNQPAYLKIIADGKPVFNGRVTSGNAYQYSANKTIELLTGNAAALSIIFNQNNLGVMGTMGQALHIIFTAQGIFTPTPAFTSTPTVTPPAILTPKATPTAPTPTITPLIPTPSK